MTRSIDVNSDLGEGYGQWACDDDRRVLDLVSSANIACGFHAGDSTIMRRTVAAAVATGTTVGAHVGYPDLQGFGRRAMDIPSAELTDIVVHQVAALAGFAAVNGTRVRYVKPHGALYNRAVVDDVQAEAVVAAIVAYDPALAVMSLPGGRLAVLAERAGLRVLREAFADRRYLPDGTLTPRSMQGSVLSDPAVVAEQAVRIAMDHEAVAVDGSVVEIEADSLCVHGDSPHAVALTSRILASLVEHGLQVASPLRAVR